MGAWATLFFFSIPIVLAILLNGKRLLAEEILPFSSAIVAFLIALLGFCLVKLITYGAALRRLDKGLSAQKFADLYDGLIKDEINETFIDKNMNIFKTVLKPLNLKY